MKKWQPFYERLSYQGKLKIIFKISFFIVAVFIVGVGLVFAKMLSEEIYVRNQEKLTVASLEIKKDFQEIESLTTEIHQNSVLQDSIYTSNDQHLSISDSALIQAQIRKEINWLLADKQYVKNLLILNSRQERIISGNVDERSIFNNRSLTEIVEELPIDNRTGKWLFDKQLEEGVYIQNLFNTREAPLEQMGTVVVLVNTSFIDDIFKDTGIFSKKDFFVLENESEFYGTNLERYEEYTDFIQANALGKFGPKEYRIETLGQNKYFVFPTTISLGNKDFTGYYFLLNMQIIDKVVNIIVVFIILVAVLMFAGIKLADNFAARFILPINQLAEQMGGFQGEADFSNLKDFSDFFVSSDRTDEIGTLYGSFQKLIYEIEHLVVKDYQSRLLSKEMEYKFLYAQLDPHFLYNTLNSINWLALSKGDAEISEMVTSLALLLRKKVNQKSTVETIEEEIELVRAYINIQKVRFKSRLLYSEQVSEEALLYEIPLLSIQPLVENAIKYGVECLNRPVRIELTISLKEEHLFVDVTDDGPGFSAVGVENKDSTGVGLSNIEARLKLTYGEEAHLTIDSDKEQTRVSFRIPIEKLTQRGEEFSDGHKINYY